MQRIALTLFGALALLLSFGASAGANGHNCGDYISQAAAQSVYLADTSDPDNLDGSPENGQACDSYDYGSNAGSNPGLLGDGASDPTAPVTDDTGASSDDGAVAGLPATGSGFVSEASIVTASLMGASALVLAGAAMLIRRTAIDRS